LPAGVSLNSNGTLSGIPAAGTHGVYTFTITASNGVAPDAHQTFTLTVDVLTLSGLEFNFSSFSHAGGGAKFDGCAGPTGTTTVLVTCKAHGIGGGFLLGTISFFNGTSLPGIPVPNSTGSTITIVPTKDHGKGSATTASILNGNSASQTLTIDHDGHQIWTYSYTTGGITYKLDLNVS
jgi:hypothetical protein